MSRCRTAGCVLLEPGQQNNAAVSGCDEVLIVQSPFQSPESACRAYQRASPAHPAHPSRTPSTQPSKPSSNTQHHPHQEGGGRSRDSAPSDRLGLGGERKEGWVWGARCQRPGAGEERERQLRWRGGCGQASCWASCVGPGRK